MTNEEKGKIKKGFFWTGNLKGTFHNLHIDLLEFVMTQGLIKKLLSQRAQNWGTNTRQKELWKSNQIEETLQIY